MSTEHRKQFNKPELVQNSEGISCCFPAAIAQKNVLPQVSSVASDQTFWQAPAFPVHCHSGKFHESSVQRLQYTTIDADL